MKSFTAFFENLTMGKKILLFLSPVITVLISMKAALLGLFILIIIDLITGIRKNLYEQGISTNPLKKSLWGSIKSYLLRKTWRKSYEYGMGIIVVIVLRILVLGKTEISAFDKVFSLVELAVIIPALIEVWSIAENLEAVSGRNILKRLFQFLPEKLKVLFTKEGKDV